MPSFSFHYDVFQDIHELPSEIGVLLTQARNACKNSYAPYSHFHVGCAIRLSNGSVIPGVNVENASYPVGICAERSALAAVVSMYPDEVIDAMAISYFSEQHPSDQPAFPCGMCRQFIAECADRNKKPFQLILAGMTGKIVRIDNPKNLLPFSFGSDDLIRP